MCRAFFLKFNIILNKFNKCIGQLKYKTDNEQLYISIAVHDLFFIGFNIGFQRYFIGPQNF